MVCNLNGQSTVPPLRLSLSTPTNSTWNMFYRRTMKARNCRNKLVQLILKNELNFMILDPDWAIFRSVTAQNPSKIRGLELPVNKALPTEISFWYFLNTIRYTKWRDLVNETLGLIKKCPEMTKIGQIIGKSISVISEQLFYVSRGFYWLNLFI